MQIGQEVQIYFYNGLTIQGFILEWSDTISKIANAENDNVITILQTKESVMAFKEIFKSKEENDNLDLKLKRKVEQKLNQNKIEKQEIKEKIFSDAPTEVKLPNTYYEYPSSFFAAAQNNSATKGPRPSSGNDQQLFKMFRKRS